MVERGKATHKYLKRYSAVFTDDIMSGVAGANFNITIEIPHAEDEAVEIHGWEWVFPLLGIDASNDWAIHYVISNNKKKDVVDGDDDDVIMLGSIEYNDVLLTTGRSAAILRSYDRFMLTVPMLSMSNEFRAVAHEMTGNASIGTCSPYVSILARIVKLSTADIAKLIRVR